MGRAVNKAEADGGVTCQWMSEPGVISHSICKQAFALEQGFFPTLQTFDAVPHPLMQFHHIILLLSHNCNFAVNRNVNKYLIDKISGM